LRKEEPNAIVRFVGTERGIEARVLPKLGWDLDLVQVSGLKTVGAVGAVKGLFKLPRAILQSRRLLKKYKPDAVIGVGGYASGPVVLAAKLMGIPTAICEQNSIPGFTNKFLSKLVRKIFIAFPQTETFFAASKTEWVGNPVRVDMLKRLAAANETLADTDPERTLRVFVCGGSQGAKAVNELASAALATLAKKHKLYIVHQTGKSDVERMTKFYEEQNVNAKVLEFILDMAEQYALADLVIGRAGATTVAELAIAGKPAIFIPFPFAADNHQEENAKAMVNAGAALSFRQSELTAEILAKASEELLLSPARLEAMRTAMLLFAKPNAGNQIADWCLQQARTR